MKTALLKILIFLTVLLPLSSRAETVLSLGFEDRERDAKHGHQKGFESFVINAEGSKTNVQINPTVRQFGKITVTLSDTLGLGYDDRHRKDLSQTPHQKLWHDVIFPSGKKASNGLKLKIDGLSPKEIYRCSIWSFDPGSPGRRVSDWFANDELVKEGYEFDGSEVPASEEEYRFEFDASADANGQLVIEGRRSSSSKNVSGRSDLGVFLNAMRIEKRDRKKEAATTGGAKKENSFFSRRKDQLHR